MSTATFVEKLASTGHPHDEIIAAALRELAKNGIDIDRPFLPIITFDEETGVLPTSIDIQFGREDIIHVVTLIA